MISPSNEENLALAAVLISCEVVVVHSIPAIISRQAVVEVDVSLVLAPGLLHHHLLESVVKFEHNVPEATFCLELQKLQLARVVHSNPRCRIRLLG